MLQVERFSRQSRMLLRLVADVDGALQEQGRSDDEDDNMAVEGNVLVPGQSDARWQYLARSQQFHGVDPLWWKANELRFQSL